MSHSAFRILANDEQINRNLVIVVNKNGQVATDTEALQTLLTSKGSPNTGISILRETSPTPSISDEIEQERSEKFEVKRQEYLMAHAGEEIDEEELENQMRQITGSMDDEIPHVTLSVENFYTPEQARKFANDVLHLGGIDNPQSLMPIDFNFRRQIIQNDHCYTPLTQSPERADNSQSSKAGVKNAQNKAVKRELKQAAKARQQVEDDSTDSGDAAMDDDEEYDEEQSGDGPDISFSESDDDNDMDFSVNDRFGKKGKKKRKYRKHKQKNMTFKDFLETGEVAQLDEEPKKKYIKSPKKVQVSRPSTSGKIVTSTTVKNTQLPVVVKKVVQPAPPPQTYTVKSINSIRKETTTQFVPLTINFMKNNVTHMPGHISVQSSTPMKSKQEIEFVESIVKDLEKTFPENIKKIQPNPIPNIMQMMESNTPPEMLDQSLSSLEQLDSGDGVVPGIEEIGDALIAVLGNDAIDELLNQNDLINFDTTHNSPPMKLSQSLVNTSMLHSTLNSSLMSEASTSSLLTSPQMPKILNKQAPGKDPVKTVVRNGRVITLPVITAPTTRGAKRRAQGDSPNQSLTSPSVGKVAKTEKTPSIKDPDSKNSSRRSSLAKSESGKSSRRQSIVPVPGVPGAPEDELDDLNSDGSWASEDDPDRLWCICLQPHSNRFMICCDKCEDWFHGKCVNVTKAMGKEIELMGKEWRCPNCKATDGVGGNSGITKKPDPKKKPFNQQKLTKFFAKSQKESTDEDVAKAMCIVCKQKSARDSSIYCSDECIQNSATKHLDDNSQQKVQTVGSKVENSKRGNVLKDKSGNVIVYDKTTGKILPLSKSPHFTTLGQWLSQNPNYKPVEPGSAQAEQILSRNRTQSQPTTPTATSAAQSPVKHQLTQSSSAEDLFSNPVKIHTGATPTAAVKKPSAQGQHSGNSGSVRSNVSMKNTSSSAGVKSANASSNSPSVSSSSNKLPVAKPDNKKLKRQVSEERPVNSSSSKYKSEIERSSVRNILKDTLTSRMQEFDHPDIPKMTDVEITGFAKDTEREMFLFFNKDTRDKYKAKYRSLKFNLSDVKNKTLIEKICAKKLTPKQLVEASSASLASEELSKWREDETKHQLEIITKAELDALSQNKIVVKTHKGEEIIEIKTAPTDILVPIVDDVESVIAKTVLSIEDPHGRYDLSRSISLNVSGGNVNSPLSSPSISSSTGRKSDARHRSRSRSKSRGKDHHHHHHKSTSSKHKKGERHRSRSPKHQSNRDKDRKSRDKSHEQSKSKKSDDHKHHRDRSRSRDKDRSSGTSSKPKDLKSKDLKPLHKAEVKPDVKSLDIQPDQQDVDLVGKILNSMGVHLDKPKVAMIKEEKIKQEVKTEAATLPMVKEPMSVVPVAAIERMQANECKQEIEIYSGHMHMADVTSFDVTASIVSGNFDDIMKGFNPRLDIAGRIDPKTALDYLDKIKKFPGKKICILRFAATDSSAYNKFFKFLLTRQRYGVIKSSSPKIKDFYVIPVEASQSLPKVLLPITGPGFIEGEANKPDLLIGVICKILPEANVKRAAALMKKVSKTSRPPGDNPIQAMFAKHKSTSSKLTMGLPEFSKSGELQTTSTRKSPADTNDDGDEPYTPFDDDDDALNPPNYNAATSAAKSANDDIGSEIDLINREIEQRQMEIQSLAKQKAMELNEEQATRIYENISVPHNLSEILSTINMNQASEMKPMEIDDNDDDGDDEYVPTAMGNMEYRAASSYSSISQAAPIVNSMMDIDERIAMFQSPPIMGSQPIDDQPSRLASMTDADLMKLVPDDAFEAPPAPKISVDRKQPSIPGLDGDDYEMD